MNTEDLSTSTGESVTGIRYKDISADACDKILNIARLGSTMGKIGILSTQLSIVELSNYLLVAGEPMRMQNLLIDRHTLETKRIQSSFCTNWGCDHLLSRCDTLYYFCGQEKSNENIQLGSVYALNFSTLSKPEELFSMGWRNLSESMSLCGNKLAYIDAKALGPCVYNLETGTPEMLPYDELPEGIDAILGVPNGVYFAKNGSLDCTIYFYDYSLEKLVPICQASERIAKLCHASADGALYVIGEKHIGRLELFSGSRKSDIDPLDVLNACSLMDSMQSYDDCLLYVAEDGSLKMLDYASDGIIPLAENACEHLGFKGGLFSKAQSIVTPSPFSRVGNWVIYNIDGGTEAYKVSTKEPGYFWPVRVYSRDEMQALEEKIENVRVSE
ncbi:hypothetical protein OBV_34660 [Oscillibacter valericigenes Sjm18-20]|nr:hypothetical protein OBV_34660 [Oscillibacter valericigenes Sjm18-20]